MKRANSSYRLQLIKEVALRHSQVKYTDPMAMRIERMINEQPELNTMDETKRDFNGCYYDEHAGGWLNKTWHSK